MLFEAGVRSSDRYVLVKVRPDGTPMSVRPTSNLEEAREQLSILNAKEKGWHVFDIQEDLLIEPRHD